MGVNYDPKTVEGFGEEWNQFTQTELSDEELLDLFKSYFRLFPWDILPESPIGFDMGCGSGRWAKLVAPKVGKLCCIDASNKALEVAQKNLVNLDKCEFHNASFDNLPFLDGSMDFGYSLGVLHHIPDTFIGIKSCVKKLKPGAPLLLYIYYAFDNRPIWFRMIWRLSDLVRRFISKLPFRLKYILTQPIALIVYYPLARISSLFEHFGFDVNSFPLSIYRNRSFYTMRTDALDRFGTRLEKRYTKSQIQKMMEEADLECIKFSNDPPYWCSLGYKKKNP